MTTNNSIPYSFTDGSLLQVVKGSNARGITKGATVRVTSVKALGAEYGHSVQVCFQVLNGSNVGKIFAFYARHMNRLCDPIVNMNDGNPLNLIKVSAVKATVKAS